MDSKEKIKDLFIDSYYDEEKEFQPPADFNNFSEKLNSSLHLMDKLEELDYDLDVNILDIINTAEIIVNKRKCFKEAVGFIFCCLCMISLALVSIIVFKTKFIIYVEIILSVLLPFALIPLASHYKPKEEI